MIRYLVHLDCHHEVEYDNPPRIGEDIYCTRCNNSSLVVHMPEEYRVRCDDCQFSRLFGAAYMSALRSADKHHSRYPSHATGIYLGRRRVAGRLPQSGMLPIFE